MTLNKQKEIKIQFSGLEIEMINIPQNDKEDFFQAQAQRKADEFLSGNQRAVYLPFNYRVLDDGGAEFIFKICGESDEERREREEMKIRTEESLNDWMKGI